MQLCWRLTHGCIFGKLPWVVPIPVAQQLFIDVAAGGVGPNKATIFGIDEIEIFIEQEVLGVLGWGGVGWGSILFHLVILRMLTVTSIDTVGAAAIQWGLVNTDTANEFLGFLGIAAASNFWVVKGGGGAADFFYFRFLQNFGKFFLYRFLEPLLLLCTEQQILGCTVTDLSIIEIDIVGQGTITLRRRICRFKGH